jgi:multisubunit Na+/H+ antiporter MnhE subunit
VVTSVLWWVGLVLVWVASLTTVSVAELAVAAGSAAVCVLVARVARRVLGVWLREAWRLPWVVLTDTVAVWGTAWRGMRKRTLGDHVREVPLGGGRSRARQAVAIMLLSAGPRTMVVGLDRRTNTVLLHGFGAEEGPMERAVRR